MDTQNTIDVPFPDQLPQSPATQPVEQNDLVTEQKLLSQINTKPQLETFLNPEPIQPIVELTTKPTTQTNVQAIAEAKVQAIVQVKGQKEVKNNVETEKAPLIQVYLERINQASELKGVGNNHYKQKKFFQAKSAYEKALQLLDPATFQEADRELCMRMAELSAILLYNVGMCFMALQKQKEAVIFFTEAITVKPTYAKAFFKRATAYHHLAQYEEAMMDIKKAFQIDRTNAEFHQLYSIILPKYKEVKKIAEDQMKEISVKIFNSKGTSSPQKIANKNNNKNKTAQNYSYSHLFMAFAFLPLAAIAYKCIFKP